MTEQKKEAKEATKEERIDQLNKEINRLTELREKILKE